MAVEGWGEKETCTKRVSDRQEVKNKERDGGRGVYFRLSFSLQYTYHGWMIGEAFLTNEMFRMLKVIRVTEFTF